MKLLFDNNLSHKLVRRLADIYPNSSHVMNEELDASEDVVIWEFAKKHDFVIVTKDSDFNDLSMIKGYPPKVIWLQIGNCKFDKIENIIRKNRIQINKFLNDSNLGVFHVEGDS